MYTIIRYHNTLHYSFFAIYIGSLMEIVPHTIIFASAQCRCHKCRVVTPVEQLLEV